MYKKEIDLTDKWLKENDDEYYDVKKRRKSSSYYLTNRQLRSIYEVEIPIKSQKLAYLSYYM